MWTSQKMAMPMIGAMTIAIHEMPLAIASSVSPWNNEACADWGSNAAPSKVSLTMARRLHGRAVRISGGAAFIALGVEIKPSDLMRADMAVELGSIWTGAP